MKPTSQGNAFCMKPYECRPTPSMFTPNHEKLVTTLPKIAMIISPRCRMNPPQRECKMIAHQSTISTAPFSFGSQPQNRPDGPAAQIPQRTVPTKLERVGTILGLGPEGKWRSADRALVRNHF